MTRPFLVLLAMTGAAASIAQTPTVDSARAAAGVGERFDGYMGYVMTPSASLRAQVDAINIQRRALYSNLAARKGVSPQEVAYTAGCQLLGRVQVGHAYMLADGIWRRRSPGEPAPVPTYCR